MLKVAYVSIPFHFSLIEKNHFVKKTNNRSEDELFIECITCHRKHHQVCAFYLENMFPKGFQCNACAKPPNRLKSKSLLKCDLSEYVETNVNNFLKTQMDGCSITVRVLSNENRFSEVKPEMQRRLIEMGKNVPSFPYRAKSIFAFQEVFGSDLCFFALYVQEYGSDCSKPNARRINIAYLDTVKFFEPANLRTMVYHKIILSYLDYSKRRGFENAYIWVSPPGKGSEYIFYAHPAGQQTMTHDILLNWYKNMLIKGKKDGTIESFNTLHEEVIKKNNFVLLIYRTSMGTSGLMWLRKNWTINWWKKSWTQTHKSCLSWKMHVIHSWWFIFIRAQLSLVYVFHIEYYWRIQTN